VARGFQRSGEFGELAGDLAGDAGAAERGVEAGGVGPDEAQAFAQRGVGEVASIIRKFSTCAPMLPLL
jgi:hypothetical protein